MLNEDAVAIAGHTNLYAFLLSRHLAEVIQVGEGLRLRRYPNVSIGHNFSGFNDLSKVRSGNAIKCLTEYLGYTFKNAVAALCEFAGGIDIDGAPQTINISALLTGVPERVFIPPEPVKGSYYQMFANLIQHRGIPSDLIWRLIDQELLYQEQGHNNMVFINAERTFAELHGSISYKPFHQVMYSDPAAFWAFRPGGLSTIPETAYICKTAIDAISLYLLLSRNPYNRADKAMYCSVGDATNQRRIDAVKAYMAASGSRTYIAVGNDGDGDVCRRLNPDCRTAVPRLQGWSDDWQYVQVKAGA